MNLEINFARISPRWLMLLGIIQLVGIGFQSNHAFAQNQFLNDLQYKDLSPLWMEPEIASGKKQPLTARPQPLGFIGDNFNRFKIHFETAFQYPRKKLEYFVTGKTKTGTDVRKFQGIMTVTDAVLTASDDESQQQQGTIEGKYNLIEDPGEGAAGVYSGKFTINFVLDESGNLLYDATDLGSNSYSNNQFEGVFTANSDSSQRVCNWGDFRIPGTKGFDVGKVRLSPAAPFVANGWENYRLTEIHPEKTQEGMEARMREQHEWWK